MKLTRLVLVAAAAAGLGHWWKGRKPGGPGAGRRLALGDGLGGAAPPSSPVAETMWTPADPAEVPATPAASPANPP